MTDAPNPAAMADRLRTAEPIAASQASPGLPDDEVEAEVEEALGRLEALPDLAVTDHVAVFEGVQQRLGEILSNVDDA